MSTPTNDSDDPFACFDPDNEESGSQNVEKTRDPDCGILSFHAGTEQALLLHVQNHRCLTEQQNPKAVLQAIDDFCIKRHWMMHCGPEKASILKDYLSECVATRSPHSSDEPFVLVELGTYCGYSSIMLAHTLQQLSKHLSSFHVYTVEVNPSNAIVAEAMIRLAKLDKHITVLVLDLNDDENRLSSLLQSKLGNRSIDFLFLDHAKDAYLSDLKQLESSGLVARGTYVAADNVIFAQIDNYRTYVKLLATQGIVETRLVESRLEYSDTDANESNQAKLNDAIELTTYLKDPP